MKLAAVAAVKDRLAPDPRMIRCAAPMLGAVTSVDIEILANFWIGEPLATSSNLKVPPIARESASAVRVKDCAEFAAEVDWPNNPR